MKRILKNSTIALLLLLCLSLFAACQKETVSVSYFEEIKQLYSIKADRNFGIGKDNADTLLGILNEGEWIRSNKEYDWDYKFKTNAEILYSSDDGVFASKVGGIVLELSDDDRCFVNEMFLSITNRPTNKYAKPVIYLYPEEKITCSVRVDFNGELTCTYPEHTDSGWKDLTVTPDGTITFPDGREYYCLYWEGENGGYEFDLSKGFCVKGSESAEFLEEMLLNIGLTPREANEFIIYWLPILEENEYNLLSFQTDIYEANAKLDITPAPDSILRVFLAIKPLEEYVEIAPQEFAPFERKGFTVVEWGASLLD